MHICLFWHFPNSSSALGSILKSPVAPMICIHHKVQQAKGCCHRKRMTPSSGCFLTLNHMKCRLFAEIHWLCFLDATLDASKLKLVTLTQSYKRLNSYSGIVEIWSRKIQLCVAVCFVSFPRIHTDNETPDVLPCFIASCPRREQSHLLEELCCLSTMALNIYRGIHLLPVPTNPLCYIIFRLHISVLWLTDEYCRLMKVTLTEKVLFAFRLEFFSTAFCADWKMNSLSSVFWSWHSKIDLNL